METPKILIIDDEAIVRKAIQKALKREGYELFFAENGAGCEPSRPWTRLPLRTTAIEGKKLL